MKEKEEIKVHISFNKDRISFESRYLFGSGIVPNIIIHSNIVLLTIA